MGKRVLLVEDDIAAVQLHAYLLQLARYQVLVAENGLDGLAVARQSQPDIILCDWQLPGLDGYAVAIQLKADPATRHIPVIAVTGLAMIGDRKLMVETKFDGCILKPVALDQFVHQVAAFLDFGARAPARNPLPAAPTNGAPIALAPQHSAPVVLIVEPDIAAFDELRRALEEADCYVLGAVHCDEVIEVARRLKPNLVLCELHLPEKDGFTVLNAIKQDPTLRQVRVALMSATGFLERDRAIGLKLGAVRFIARPAAPPALVAEVLACLTTRKSWLS